MGSSREVLGPLVIPRSRRRTVSVVAIALALLIGILAVRLQSSDEGKGLLALQVIPIALVALELGLLPGGVRGRRTRHRRDLGRTPSVHIAPLEYLARAAVFLPVALVGWAAGRSSSASASPTAPATSAT